MIKLLFIALFQAAMLAGGQVLLKLGMQRIEAFTWTWPCILHDVLLNGWLLIGAVLLIAANLFWLWMLNKYPFSIIYPLTSTGIVFGMLAGMLIFHEPVNWLQWAGVVLIMGGCYCIAR